MMMVTGEMGMKKNTRHTLTHTFFFLFLSLVYFYGSAAANQLLETRRGRTTAREKRNQLRVTLSLITIITAMPSGLYYNSSSHPRPLPLGSLPSLSQVSCHKKREETEEEEEEREREACHRLVSLFKARALRVFNSVRVHSTRLIRILSIFSSLVPVPLRFFLRDPNAMTRKERKGKRTDKIQRERERETRTQVAQ